MATKNIKPLGIRPGDLYEFLSETVDLVNELKADNDNLKANLMALYGKLDADAGVTDANYESVLGQGGSDDDAINANVSASDLALDRLKLDGGFGPHPL
jgi:hypothetical protein